MKTVRWSALFGMTAMAAIAAAACSKGSVGAAPSPSGGASAATAAADPVIELAKPVAATCKFDEYGNVAMDCPAYKAWDESKQFEDGKSDASLVKMLEDSDEKMRRLSVDKLWNNGRVMMSDKDLATRVVAAAEKETSPKVLGFAFGNAVGGIKLDKAPLFDRITALVKSGKDATFRKAIVERLIGANPTDAAVWAWQKERIKDAEAPIRVAAIKAFWGNPFNLKPAETCAVYKENFTHSDPAVAAVALAHSTGSKTCVANLDAVYDEIEKRVKAHNVPEDTAFDLFNGLRDTWGDQGASDKQKKRRLAIAEAAALDAKLPPRVRRVALDVVKSDDPKGLKAFAAKLQNDKEKDVADLAKSYAGDKK